MPGAFLFDANKCTGCGACRVACTIENGLAPDVSWRRIDTFNPQHRPIAPVFHVSLACNHCATAACMRACPALAYRRDGPTGAVLLDSSLCIGCGYCSWACPYDAPVFDEAAGVMTKCTWCAGRLAAGLKPACATHCPTGALDYADVAPSAAAIAPGFRLPGSNLQPRLHVIPLRAEHLEMAAAPDLASVPSRATEGTVGDLWTAGASPGISLRRDWPLAVFTFGASVLVGLVSGAAAGRYRLSAWAFLLGAIAVLGVAGLHLGRKERAWRAVLNVRRSWLSRELVVLSLFVTIASSWLLLAPGNAAWGWAAALTGFAGLFCADSVYSVLPGGSGYRHSAGVTTTGAVLGATLSGATGLAVVVILLKALLYVTTDERRGGHSVLNGCRVVLGFIAPVILLTLVPNQPGALASILVAEAIGRCKYYEQLTRRTPRSEMDRELAAAGLAPRAAMPA